MFDHAEYLKDPTEASCLEGVLVFGDGIVTFQDSEPCRRTPVMFVCECPDLGLGLDVW